MNKIQEFDLELFLRNIKVLAKDQGKKISEVEDAGAVSHGYLSRLENGTIKTVPSIMFVKKIADFFKISIDALISHEYERILNEETYFLIDFIKSLTDKTVDKSVQWELESFETDSIPVFYSSKHSEHPLFEEYVYKDSPKARYCSKFESGNSQHILSDSIISSQEFNRFVNVIRLKSDDKTYIYLANIVPLVNPDALLKFAMMRSKYEMYLIKNVEFKDGQAVNGEVTNLCNCSAEPADKSSIKEPLINLYNLAYKSTQNPAKPTLSEETKSILNKFLN